VNSLNRLDKRGEFLIQCVNAFMKPVDLLTGSLVRKFYSMQEEDVRPAIEKAEETHGVPTTNRMGPVPGHYVNLYRNACDGCRSNRNTE